MLVFVCLLGCVVCAVIGAALASEKRRSSEGFLLGLFFGPIGIIIALLLPAHAAGGRNQGTKHCPYCGKLIGVKDMECPGCGRSQPVRPTNADWEKAVAGGADVEGLSNKEDDPS